MTVKIITPVTTPNTVPTPPLNETPPTTHAAGLVPQDPNEENGNQRVESDIRQTERAQRYEPLGKLRKVAIKAGNRRRANEVVIQRVNTVNDDHRTEGGDKWRHVQVGNNNTVDKPNHRADRTNQQDNQRNRHRGHVREHFVGVVHRL